MKNILTVLLILLSLTTTYCDEIEKGKKLVYKEVIGKLKKIKVGDPLSKVVNILGKLPPDIGSSIQTYYFKDSNSNAIIVNATLEDKVINIKYQRTSTNHAIEEIVKKKKP